MGSVLGGVASGITSLIGGGARRREEKNARSDFQNRQDAYNSFDFANQYEGLENTAEDLTVNRQASNFQGQQTDQALAQGLDTIRQTGGGGGSAQAIANAALQSKQNISNTIASQEQGNQQLRAQQAAQNQQLEAQGATRVQDQEFGRVDNQYTIASQRYGAAKQARQDATAASVKGLVSVGALAAGGLVGGGAAGTGSFGKTLISNAKTFGGLSDSKK